MKWLFILFSMVALKTCDNSSSEKQKVMLNETYGITHLNNKDVSEFKLTISFKDSTKQVSGFSGCNRFFGSYELKDNKFLFGPLASTKMMCEPKFNELENSMLDALSKVNSLSLEEDTLKLSEGSSVLIKAKKQNLSVSFEYSQHSRNSFQRIKINRKSISVQNKRDGVITKIDCNNEQWTKLTTAFNNIDVKAMVNLEAPSQKRFFDGAAIANFKVTTGGKIYETPSFDHGNPHADIAILVKEILSIAQNIE